MKQKLIHLPKGAGARAAPRGPCGERTKASGRARSRTPSTSVGVCWSCHLQHSTRPRAADGPGSGLSRK